MFYSISQNNSGGYFIKNKDVAEFLIIEAEDKEDFINRLENITKDYSEYCPCCGERWELWGDEEPTEKPTIWGESPEKFFDDNYYRNHEVIIHYIDGRKEKINSQGK